MSILKKGGGWDGLVLGFLAPGFFVLLDGFGNVVVPAVCFVLVGVFFRRTLCDEGAFPFVTTFFLSYLSSWVFLNLVSHGRVFDILSMDLGDFLLRSFVGIILPVSLGVCVAEIIAKSESRQKMPCFPPSDCSTLFLE